MRVPRPLVQRSTSHTHLDAQRLVLEVGARSVIVERSLRAHGLWIERIVLHVGGGGAPHERPALVPILVTAR